MNVKEVEKYDITLKVQGVVGLQNGRPSCTQLKGHNDNTGSYGCLRILSHCFSPDSNQRVKHISGHK